MSDGERMTTTYRSLASRIGKLAIRAKPAEMPVIQPTRFERVVNRKAARALGIVLPKRLLLSAHNVIQ